MKQIVVLLVIIALPFFVSGLTCYYCQSESDKSTCVNGDYHNVTECTKKYCTIYRQELIDPPGKLRSFSRSCQDNPLYLDAVIYSDNDNFKSYYRSCRTDLCNRGDGLHKISENIIASSSNGTIIIVPGVGSGTQISSPAILYILISIFLPALTEFHQRINAF